MTLQEICELIVDCPHITDNDEGFGYPLIRTPNVGKGMLLLENVHRVSKDVYDRRNKRAKPQPYDLILAREAPAGNVALIHEGHNVCLGQRTVLIRPNKKVVVPEYLTYYLLAPYNQHRIKESANGSTVEHVNMPNIRGLEIELPALDIQKRIASILSNYDTLIDINTKRIKLLEESARELYKEWFVRMRFPGYEQTKFVKGIPGGWKNSLLQDFGRIETGKTPSMEKPEYYGGEYLFIKTPDMHDSMFVLDTTETLSEAGNNCQRNKLLPVNSIMVSCIGSTGIGAVAINAKQGHTNQQINSIILFNQEWLTWLYFTCESLKPTIEMYGATGSTMTNLSKGKFENLKVIEPTADIIRQFNKLESPLFEEIKNLQIQNQNLAATRDRLLPRLLSGELKVKA